MSNLRKQPSDLCKEVVAAIQAAQKSLGPTGTTYTALTAHWELEHRLLRLVESAHDVPAQTLAPLETHIPNLECDVREVVASNQYTGVVGIQLAREQIANSVAELKRMKEESATPFGLSA